MSLESERSSRGKSRYTELGLQPITILTQVQTGSIPPGWQVFTGRKKSLVRKALHWNIHDFVFYLVLCGILTLPVFLCENYSSLISLVTDAEYRASFNFWSSPMYSLPYVFLLLFVSLYLLSLFIALIMDLAASDPVLVILPDGLVEFDQMATISSSLTFKELTTIRHHQRIGLDDKETKPGALDLVYHDGIISTWTPLTPSMEAIVSAFQQWQAIHNI